ncbi:hypothetical protein HMPREF1981_00338 [Bacteroides pyogenes F0041]|uniref:Uncharacterized protein n=1 Tax=Bacteroides pyogenes F0041 TaxID=1321819 RepID=U2CXB6_9BACE|nr:hypothetical protein HMPREF1981_00338 [Bacteroides pyogenes F0041]GAE21766.1 hypothetical protein JCM10003_1264 [Bacteroides pyogenes JCM 10003]
MRKRQSGSEATKRKNGVGRFLQHRFNAVSISASRSILKNIFVISRTYHFTK